MFYGIHNVFNHTHSESDPEIMGATLKARVPQLITVAFSDAMEKKLLLLRSRFSSHQLRVCNSSSLSSISRPSCLFHLQETSFHQTTGKPRFRCPVNLYCRRPVTYGNRTSLVINTRSYQYRFRCCMLLPSALKI